MSQNNDNQGLSIEIGDELSKNLTIHKNVKQEIIITTADKIKLVLISTREILRSQRDWWTPAGLLLSFIATLVTADFKDALTLTKEFWHAIFVILTIASSVWLIISLYKLLKNWGQDDLSMIIEQIKVKNTEPVIQGNEGITQENSQIVITKGINILSATYEWPTGQIDLTEKIKEFVLKGILTITVDPATFGIPDPAFGIVKTLKIHCKIDGKERVFQKKDFENLRIE
jgi:hypothetical protein